MEKKMTKSMKKAMHKMMKKTVPALALILAGLAAPAAAYASAAQEETETAAEYAITAGEEALAAESETEAAAPEQDWDTGIATEITGGMQALFERAAAPRRAVSYEPVAVLAVQEEEDAATTCFLCRGTVVYPGAKPGYVLMYVHETADGEVSVQNIWDLWIDAHSEKKE